MITQGQLGKLLADNDILGNRISRLEKQNTAEHKQLIELKNQNKFLVDQNTILIDKIELLRIGETIELRLF